MATRRDDRHVRMRWLPLAVAVCLTDAACAGGDGGPASTPPPRTAAPGTPAPAPAPMLIPIRNARIPAEGVLSGGQPTPEQVEAAARAGFRTVINLRTDGEPGFEWERGLVERLGMTYVHIPVGGPDTLTRDTIAKIDAALDEAVARGPVLYHCASGNRIGASLALRSAWMDGAPADDAFRYGLASGMTRLTRPVAEMLGVDVESN